MQVVLFCFVLMCDSWTKNNNTWKSSGTKLPHNTITMHINTPPPGRLLIPTLELALCITQVEESSRTPVNGPLCAAALLPWRRNGSRFGHRDLAKSTVLKLGHYVFWYLFLIGGVKAGGICLRNKLYLDVAIVSWCHVFCWHLGAGPSAAGNGFIRQENPSGTFIFSILSRTCRPSGEVYQQVTEELTETPVDFWQCHHSYNHLSGQVLPSRTWP